jgi:hypothetical protein
MKSIIINKDQWITKNNKANFLYYGYRLQEDIWHNKQYNYRFQGKEHYYYVKHCDLRCFNHFVL